MKLRFMLMLVCASLLATQSGCILLSELLGQRNKSQLDTSLLEAQGYSIPPGGMPTQVKPDPSGKPRVVLEIRTGENQRHVESIPLPMDRGLFIQDVVQQANLHESFGNLSISIMRSNGGGAPPVRMDCRTDEDGAVTDMGANYALLPGDHIVVLEDQRSALERFLTSQFR